MKQEDRFIESLRQNVQARWTHDQQQYSEPMMILNMYKAWLEASSVGTKDRQRSKNKFCYDNSVMKKRLNVLENTVAEIMESVLKMIPKATDMYQKVNETSKSIKISYFTNNNLKMNPFS